MFYNMIMVVANDIYDERFFVNSQQVEGDSPAQVVNILQQLWSPRSVIDIGCGNGLYLKEW